MVPDMMYKPDWVELALKIVRERMAGKAYDEGTAAIYALLAYQESDDLGGKEGYTALAMLRGFREALGIERLPDDIEDIGWQLVTF